jgi:hypothetical protein
MIASCSAESVVERGSVGPVRWSLTSWRARHLAIVFALTP